MSKPTRRPARSRMRLCTLAMVAGFNLAAGGVHAASVFVVVPQADITSVTIGGSVVPAREVTLAAQIPGRVAAIAGKEGDHFDTGAVLVSLDEAQLRAQRKQAEAAYRNADAAVRNAQVQYQRELVSPQSERATSMPGMGMPGMFDQMFSRPMAGMMSMESSGAQRGADLHAQGTQMSQAQASLEQARAQIEQIDAQLRDARSVAPFDGVIVKKLAEIGDTVQPGQPLLDYADVATLQIQADIPARLTAGLAQGQIIDARLDRGRGELKVVVDQIFPVADAQQHTVTVKFNLPADVRAAPGMYAEVLVPDPHATGRATLRIPRAALVRRGGLAGVQVLDDKGAPSLRLLRVKETRDPDWVEVYAGLKPGERIQVP